MPRTTIKKHPVEKKADEHAADPKEAAAAVDAKAKKWSEASKAVKASRTDERTVKRAVELRKQGLGLPAIAKKLTEEGHKSAHGKELRPQTVRQWLLRELKVDRLGPTPQPSSEGES
jgi:hypothetical protein